jgi:mRNA interferase MazF
MTGPCRGEVWSVNFDPQVGAEMTKLRPAAVINPDCVGRLPLRIVVPITEWQPQYAGKPWLVHLSPTRRNGLGKESAADCFQVKSIALQRFVDKMGDLTSRELSEIAAAIALCVGL